jgi:MFS family permease
MFTRVVIPATASMIGLETSPEAQSTVFGFNASSVALGFFLGPGIGGTVAATAGVSTVISGLAVLLALLMAVGAREPGVQTLTAQSLFDAFEVALWMADSCAGQPVDVLRACPGEFLSQLQLLVGQRPYELGRAG